MSLHLIDDFPEARRVPSALLRAFREIDPQADVLYLGPRRWMLGHVHQDGCEMQAKLQRMGDARVKLGREIRKVTRDREWYRRQWFARAMQQGFESIHEWTVDELTSWHVEAFRAASYLKQNLRTDALADYDRALEQQKQADLADLTDPARATDAWRYAFTLTPRLQSTTDRVRSGYTRHALSSPAA
jgi:hypothetical protein